MKSLIEKEEKLVGYAILIAGLCIMGYSKTSVISISNGGRIPLEILKVNEEDINQDLQYVENGSNNTIPQINFGQILTPLFPMFNLIAWLLVIFILLIAGGRVALIGINMMKATIPDVKIIRNETIKKIEKKITKPNDDKKNKT